MKKLLNTLFVTSENAYLALEGENVVIYKEKVESGRYPLHIINQIISFSYAGASPALMGACANRSIGLSFLTPRGQFLARITNESNGNVLLRREQYRIADDLSQSCLIARRMIFGKVYNCRWSVERTLRDHSLRIDSDHFKSVSNQLKNQLSSIYLETNLDSLRGLEGVSATAYFSVFNNMILARKEIFSFNGRSRRPPLDPVNALLSFAYTLLANECASSLESVGLDAYVGFMHRDKPGRQSLALDLMEELRPCMADRFVLSCINNRMFDEKDFQHMGSGAVLLNENARAVFLKSWHAKQQEVITHPYLNEKIEWGLVPYVQSLLLSRYIRKDLDDYPPFLWK